MTDDEYRKFMNSDFYKAYVLGGRNQGKTEHIRNIFNGDYVDEKPLHNHQFSPIFNKDHTARFKQAKNAGEVVYVDEIEYIDAADPIYAKLQSEKDKNRPVIIEMVCTMDLENNEIVYMTEIEFQYNPRCLGKVINK